MSRDLIVKRERFLLQKLFGVIRRFAVAERLLLRMSD